MDFDLSKAQKDIQKAARKFAKGEFDRELAMELERKHQFPLDICRKAGELGFIGLHFPEKYGGQGYGCLENALVIEEFCRADSSIGSATLLCAFASENILRFGTEEQKQRYLPPITAGQEFFGGAITEPDHGSDITRMATTAARDGDEWVINGGKTFISNAGIAHNFMVLCQTDPAAAHQGQSMILVPADAPGLEISDLGNKMGIRLSPTGELTFKNVRVPAANLLGAVNKGFYQVLQFFDESRVEVAAQALGIAQGAFDRALEYTKKREQFQTKIAALQVTQHKLADMATKIELARLITHKAAWTIDQGRIDATITSMAKYYVARTAVEVTDEAVQLLGGYGYMADFDVERYYRDAKITEIYEGTKEIQKNTIARGVIGRLA
ncbi:MAG: acyl-CoA dehydrogenase family protein [Planctomycetota bacterium]